jgi:DNA-binding MarR family transcriptional regulator
MNPLLKLDNQLCFAVYAAAHGFNRVYKPLLEPLGLTYPQYLVMLVLWEQGSATVTQLGEKLMLDSGTLTPLLKRLEANGFVSRRRSEEDERKVIVTLTDTGSALEQRAQTVPESLFCATGLTPEALQALRGTLVDLRRRLAGD